MSSTAEDKPTPEGLSKGEDAEADVPDDFFDDFSNNDFMAGLDVVDAWEDGLNIGQTPDREPAKTTKDHRMLPQDGEEADKIPIKDSIKSDLKQQETKIEGKKVVTNSNNFKLNSEPIKSPVDYEVSSNASTDSDSMIKIDPKLDLKDLKLNSQCKVILENDLKTVAKEKLMKIPYDNIKGDSKENTDISLKKIKNYTKEPKKQIVEDLNELEDEKPKDTKNSTKSSKIDSKNQKSSRDPRRDHKNSRDSRRVTSDVSSSRRDPDKTKRDIQRNKEKILKDKEAKYLEEKLRLVETGLVPPGTEMDVDLNKEQEDKLTRKVIPGDLRCKIRGADRRERDRVNRSSSRERNDQSLSKRRHSEAQSKPSQSFKRDKDSKLSTSNDNISLSPSPDRQLPPQSKAAALLERRGRYNVAINDYQPPRSPALGEREHSGSSSRRTLTISEDMVRSLASNESVIGGAVMGKGERIPRRILPSGRSRSRSRSYEKYRAYKRSPSPTLRGYGGAVSKSRAPVLIGGREIKRERSRSPIRERRERDYKPRNERERDRRSPREIELTRDGHRRDRSLSPQHRRKAPTFLEELNEKLSKQQSNNPSYERRTFLEEIREKINQASSSTSNINPPSMPIFQPGTMMADPMMGHQFHSPAHITPVPAPVPPPQQFHQQIPPTPIVYDQSFFIGDGPPGPPIVLANPMPQMMDQPPMMLRPAMMQPQPNIKQIPLQMNLAQAQVEPSLPILQEFVDNQKLDKESIAQLFNDKQITLTDFLSITSKVAGCDRPVDLTNKIKVISRCQDAAKVMSKEIKATGRFLMRKRQSAKQQPPTPENKSISPLKRNPAIRFRFTSKVPLNDEMVYRSSVQLLLHKLGLPDGTEPLRDPTPDLEEALPPPSEAFVPHKPVIVQEYGNNLKEVVPSVVIPPPKKEVLQKMCQTEPVNLCRECKVRSEKKFVSVGCQYDEKVSVSVGTQVNGTEDAFTPARANLQGLLKSRSLASLTPAQILAQVAATKETPTKDEPPFISPEPKRGRIDAAPNNWNQERDSDYDRSLMATRRDLFYNEQQQERQLQQQLQMTMDLQQKNRLQHGVSRDMNSGYQGMAAPMFPATKINSGMAGNNQQFINNPFPMNSANTYGGPNAGMMGNQGFNPNSNQFGPNNQNFGGNRFYNYD